MYSCFRQGYTAGCDEGLTYSRLVLRVHQYRSPLMSDAHSVSTVTGFSVLHIGSYNGPSSVRRTRLDRLQSFRVFLPVLQTMG